MVNGALGRSLEYSMYSLWKNIEGPLRNFLKANLQPHPRPDQRPRTLGACGPQVFGLWSGLGCGLGYAFRKSLGGPSIFSLGSTLSTLGKLPRGSIHHATSLPFPQIVPLEKCFKFLCFGK